MKKITTAMLQHTILGPGYDFYGTTKYIFTYIIERVLGLHGCACVIIVGNIYKWLTF